MRKKEQLSPPAIGGSSLLVIFAVLCLTVLALLSLSTAQAERRMSDINRDSVTRYYAADLQAQEIFARIREGEEVPGVTYLDHIRGCSYSCPISENQTLVVELEKTGDSWTVLRWQTVTREAQIQETMPVWNGT